MRINNHGLSITKMIIYSAILIIALLFVIRIARQVEENFSANLKEAVKGKITYEIVENTIEEKAVEYIDKYYKNVIGFGTITVTTESLLKHQLLNKIDLQTDNSDTCIGYALVKKDAEENIKADAFIACEQYKTKEFQEWRMKKE